MLTGSLHLMGRFTLVMPKTATAAKFGNTSNASIDVAALLKKSGATGGAESRIEDTVEITGTHKKTDAPAEENWAKDLASYVSGRNKEIRESIPKPIPPEMAWAIINADYPGKEEVERGKAVAAKLAPIDAKLKSGKQLKPDELDFLRENYPEYYLLAIRIEREMEQLRKQLGLCDTMEEKLELVMEKKKQLLGASKVDPGYAQCMLAAIDEELKKM